MNMNMLSHVTAIQSALTSLPMVALNHVDSAAGVAALEYLMATVYGMLPAQIKNSTIGNSVYTGLEKVSTHYLLSRTVNTGSGM